MDLEPIEKLQPFRHFCMSIGELPSSYMQSMTYLELLMWLCKYLENTVIPTINNNAQAVEVLQGLFVQLHDYVENYFDNLDVQEEINNKLDEMVEDGTLQEIIIAFINSNAEWCYDTVDDMKSAENLVDGCFAKTAGYYSINDGGSAFYKIRTKTNEDINNGGNIIFLDNSVVVAEIIPYNDMVNIKQFGAKGDNIQDDTNYIQNALNYNKNVFIPSGTYKITSITLNQNQYLHGEGRKSKFKTSQSYGVIVPRSADRCTLKDFMSEGGFSIGLSGTASEQDMNCVFDNLVCSGGYGFHISHRGHQVINCRAGGTEYGFYIDGTDNNISNCISANVQKHGFAITGANNNVVSCKSFLAGGTNYGVGFILTGAFCRLCNCEAQQNYYENYFIQNSYGSIITGCLSDGAFWGKSNISQYDNNTFGTINTSAILVHNINGVIIDITNINGSIFTTPASTHQVLLIPYPNTIHKNSINITNYIRNNYTNIMTDINLYRLVSNNNIVCDGINYNSFITKRFTNSFSHAFQQDTVESNVRLGSIRIPSDSLALNVYFPSVSDKQYLQTLFWDFIITYVDGGVTKYKNISNQNISTGNNSYYNIQEVLDTINVDSITAIDVRFIATNKANSPAFVFSIDDVVVCPTLSDI